MRSSHWSSASAKAQTQPEMAKKSMGSFDPHVRAT
jgi:hypothetical protein